MNTVDTDQCPIPPIHCSHCKQLSGTNKSKYVCEITGEPCNVLLDVKDIVDPYLQTK